MKMNLFNLIKLRKFFLLLILFSLIYLIQKFIYFSRRLQSTIEIKVQNPSTEHSIQDLNHAHSRTNSDKISFKEHFRISRYVDNCGIKDLKCSDDEFSIHLNTGFQNSIYPQLCIDGKYLPDRFFNRGINLVIIDNTTRTLTNAQNFETNLKDSTNFEAQLLSLRQGDILILFTFDEIPAKLLSKVAKLILNELGSVHVQNLQFRTAWYLISEKQINGYSPYEEIHLPVQGMRWPPPLNLQNCIPFQIKGDFIKTDQALFTNHQRVEYCKQFKNKWKGFCDNDVMNEPLYTISTTSNLLKNTPILIFSDPDKNDLISLTLETIFRQSGIVPKNVLIFYFKESSNELKNLANLFLFKSFKVDLNLNSKEFFEKIEQKIKQEFIDAKQFIILFGNLIVTADFLNYFTQLIPLFWYPESRLSFISAWNDNCSAQQCTDEKLISRVSGNNSNVKIDLKHSIAIKYDHNFFSLLEKLILLNTFKNESIIFDNLEDSSGLIPDFPRVIVSKETSDLFLNGKNNEKTSLFENVKLNQIESLYTVESYKKSLDEFKINSLNLKGGQSLMNYLDTRQNNTSVNITVLFNSTNFNEICTILNLKYCSSNLYYINGMGNTMRFNYDNHLSVLLIEQQGSSF